MEKFAWEFARGRILTAWQCAVNFIFLRHFSMITIIGDFSWDILMFVLLQLAYRNHSRTQYKLLLFLINNYKSLLNQFWQEIIFSTITNCFWIEILILISVGTDLVLFRQNWGLTYLNNNKSSIISDITWSDRSTGDTRASTSDLEESLRFLDHDIEYKCIIFWKDNRVL